MHAHKEESHPFYGQDIYRTPEQVYIRTLLKKYENHPVDDELKRKVWEELMREKSQGKISIPFKIAIRRDATGKFPPFLEIILDTKV